MSRTADFPRIGGVAPVSAPEHRRRHVRSRPSLALPISQVASRLISEGTKMVNGRRNIVGVRLGRVVAIGVAMSALFALTGCGASEESAPPTTEDPNFLGMWVSIGDDCKPGEYGADMRKDLGETLLYCEGGQLTDGSAAAARDREDKELQAATRQVTAKLETCGAREITGNVRNNSDRRVDVTLQITVTDANGVRVDDFLASVPRLDPRTTAQFNESVFREYRTCRVTIDSVRFSR